MAQVTPPSSKENTPGLELPTLKSVGLMTIPELTKAAEQYQLRIPKSGKKAEKVSALKTALFERDPEYYKNLGESPDSLLSTNDSTKDSPKESTNSSTNGSNKDSAKDTTNKHYENEDRDWNAPPVGLPGLSTIKTAEDATNVAQKLGMGSLTWDGKPESDLEVGEMILAIRLELHNRWPKQYETPISTEGSSNSSADAGSDNENSTVKEQNSFEKVDVPEANGRAASKLAVDTDKSLDMEDPRSYFITTETAKTDFEWQKKFDPVEILCCGDKTQGHSHQLENGEYVVEKLPRGGRVAVASQSQSNPGVFKCSAVKETNEIRHILLKHDRFRSNLSIVPSSHQKLKGILPKSLLILFMVEVPLKSRFNTYIYGISFDDDDDKRDNSTARPIVRYTETDLITRFGHPSTQELLHKWCLVAGQRRKNKKRALDLIPDYGTMKTIYGEETTKDCLNRAGVFKDMVYELPELEE